MKINDEKLNRLLPEIEERIRDSFGEKVKKIVLFGSYARGDYNEESDIDILVIVDDENLSFYKKQRTKLTTYYMDKEEIFLSIVIQKVSITDRYKNHSPFLMNVNNDGIVLYG